MQITYFKIDSSDEISKVVNEYNKGTQKISKIRITDDAWEYTDVKEFTIDVDDGILKTGSQNYSLDGDAKAFSNGLEIGLEEINERDEITLKGYGTNIYSIIVTKGHGYIVLENTESFVGGLIDIGSEIVTEIENGMVITAPEGTYTVTVTKNGAGGSQEIVVIRDTEITLDISRLQTSSEMGSIKFSIIPSTAKLYIDGTITNLDLDDISPYVRKFSKNKIKNISGIINVESKTQRLSAKTNRVTSSIVINNLNILGNNYFSVL